MGQPETIEDLKFFAGRKKITYTVTNKAEYIGFAERGSPTSKPCWKITRLTYNVNDLVSDVDTAYGSWDDRLSLTYE